MMDIGINKSNNRLLINRRGVMLHRLFSKMDCYFCKKSLDYGFGYNVPNVMSAFFCHNCYDKLCTLARFK